MSNSEHHVRLSEGAVPWNSWRGANPHIQIDLSHAEFSGLNLRNYALQNVKFQGSRLSGADLRGADLTQADFTGAVLEQVNFSGAYMHNTNFSDSDLSDAKLVGAYLGLTIFTRAFMRGVDFTNAVLNETVFGGTVLSAATGLDECQHSGPSTIDYRTLGTLSSFDNLPKIFLKRIGLPDVFIEYLPSLLSKPFEYYKCFISYSHQDARFARALYDQLLAQNVPCWLDEHDMQPGDDIHSTVIRIIRSSDKVLLCCSQHSLTSWWVDAEVDAAFEKERHLMKDTGDKVNVVIPLDLDGYLFSENQNSPKMDTLKSRKAADFRSWEQPEEFNAKIDELLNALRE